MIWFWFSLAIITLIFELSAGILYFLVLSIAFFITGFYTYFFEPSSTLSVTIASFLSIIGVVIAFFIHQRKNQQSQAQEELQDLDVGQIVSIEQKITDKQYYVSYRGTLWEAIVEDSALVANPGNQAMIIGKNGNTLIIRLSN